MRSVTFEVPFKAILKEPGVGWFRDAVPTMPASGPRILAKTHGSDEVLAAIHRDRPIIGLVCPRHAVQPAVPLFPASWTSGPSASTSTLSLTCQYYQKAHPSAGQLHARHLVRPAEKELGQCQQHVALLLRIPTVATPIPTCIHMLSRLTCIRLLVFLKTSGGRLVL